MIFAVLTVALILAIQRGRMGRLLGGLSDSPTALELHGATTNVIQGPDLLHLRRPGRVLRGAAGVSRSTIRLASNYTSFSSLTLVALIIISVGGVPWYAIVAAVGLTVFPGYVTSPNVNTYLEIVFGFFAATYAVFESRSGRRSPLAPQLLGQDRRPATRGGLHQARRGPCRRLCRQRRGGRGQRPTSEQMQPAPVTLPGSGLQVDHLSVHFGGVKAVNDVTLAAPLGRITGLLGPTGPGRPPPSTPARDSSGRPAGGSSSTTPT